jgi:hypothetical protein
VKDPNQMRAGRVVFELLKVGISVM